MNTHLAIKKADARLADVVQFRELSHSFGGRLAPIFSDISLDVRQGEKVFITGPSGSGKTTLLNIMGGLLRPRSGSVVLFGHPAGQLTDHQIASLRAREIGLVFQSPNLVPVLTAFENVDLALQLACPELSRSGRATQVEQALRIANLWDRKDARPRELSGGECQRAALARALVKKPKLVLADEPTSQLDDENCDRIRRVLRQMVRDLSVTLVVATHDARILADADRVLRLDHGELRRVETGGLPFRREGGSDARLTTGIA